MNSVNVSESHIMGLVVVYCYLESSLLFLSRISFLFHFCIISLSAVLRGTLIFLFLRF